MGREAEGGKLLLKWLALLATAVVALLTVDLLSSACFLDFVFGEILAEELANKQ